MRASERSLENWCKNNNRMDLLSEWDYGKNILLPMEVAAQSGKKAFWKCSCGHEWETAVSNRVRGSGCPKCARTKREESIKKALLNKNGSFENWCMSNSKSGLLEEWDYEKNTAEGRVPSEISARSKQEAWWRCKKCGYLWKSSIVLREKGARCPKCAKKERYTSLVETRGSFEKWCEDTQRLDLLREWDYEKNEMLPSQVTSGSKKKVWWLCGAGHSFQQSVCQKTSRAYGCPYCSTSQSSLAEKVVAFYVENYFEIEENYRPDWLSGKEIDVYIPSISTGVEYDGARWHKDVEKDLIKNRICRKNSVRLIRIREEGCPFLEGEECVLLQGQGDRTLQVGVIELLTKLGIVNPSVNVAEDKISILGRVKALESKKSLREWCIQNGHQDILEAWSEKNGEITPEKISAHSGQKIWWHCKMCGNDWLMQVNSITSGQRCPSCAGKLRKESTTKTWIARKGSLYDWCQNNGRQDLLEEWDEEANEMLMPGDVTRGSKKMVWWRCGCCGTKWQSTILNRTNGNGCPCCGNKKRNAIMNAARNKKRTEGNKSQ